MHFWSLPLQSLFSELKATPQGLTTSQVLKRRKQFGPNAFDTISHITLLRIFFLRFQNPLIILLLIAAAISAVVHDIHSAILITIMVFLSISIDAVQDFRASNAAEALKQSVALRPLVLRDQQLVKIPLEDLVPGDIVCLSAGDLVPADGRLLEAKDLFVNQSLLTGESYPVEKSAQDFRVADETITNAPNAVFMGTSILSGTAQYIVCLTGKITALGVITSTLSTQAPPTAFEIGMRQFGLLLMRLILFLILFVILANLFFDRPWLETLLFALALGVGLAPEFLPMVVSITLARGAVRMARKNVIVKRLSSIHDFGSMDILCCDKTGTLTEAKIQLAQHLDLKGEKNDHVFQIAYLNSYFETGLKSPLDEAILAYQHLERENWEKIDEIPFDFERRRVSVLVDNGKKRLLLVKGAPEDILAISTHFEDEPRPLSPKALYAKERRKIQNQFNDLSQQGFRVLGIAWREVPRTHSQAVIHDESGLTFAGFATFFDPPKSSAAEALKKLHENGVKLKIVTGDNELVTQHLCQQLNIPIDGLLMGHDIDSIDDSALSAKIEKVNLFCRMNPTQKCRIITLLKSKGHMVGFIGDGINDAPSLHSANVAVSVDSGVDVAKEAADIILLKQDLNVIYDGIIEGRTTYGNIMKYVMMMTSSNFGNMISMAGAALFLPFLPMLPTQILLNNLLYDLSEIAIPLDNVDKNFLEKPHRWKMSSIRNFMFMMGPISSVFDFLTFAILLYVFKASETLFHTGWFMESLATQILVIFIIRTRLSPLKSRPHPILAISSISLASLGIIIPFTQLGAYFSLTPLPTSFFIILGILCASYLLLAEGGKRVFYRYSINGV
ncbi:metal ABC transporter ATPase [Candidatus Paracaedibacter acanthamoebae]|uniref:Magnesium-transporting ATPase, P-type 1 n=2 Tax=Candidatus Odyssella acanthamoebae TaxID=91604 RepID=A0A077AR47_9PROT|nr:metal ABC transporter ATPase [Candidatus Paracaedibacter acanthamoebae]